MKSTLKIFGIVILTVLVFIILFSLSLSYLLPRSSETILEERFDKENRITYRKSKGNDCCEGDFIKTEIFDNKGRVLKEFGNKDNSRYKNVWRYDKDNLLFKGYYSIYKHDTLNNEINIDEEELDWIREVHYYANKQEKSSFFLNMYKDCGYRDTGQYEFRTYNSKGQLEFDKMVSNEIEYLPNSNEYDFIQYTIRKDVIKNTFDTSETKKIKCTTLDN